MRAAAIRTKKAVRRREKKTETETIQGIEPGLVEPQFWKKMEGRHSTEWGVSNSQLKSSLEQSGAVV